MVVFASVLLLWVNLWAENSNNGIQGECTIAVISGTITVDGRPIIWKNRDVGDPDQRFIYYSPYYRDGIETFAFMGNCYRSDTTRIYMGVNDPGFAIMNSDSYNLDDSLWRGVDDGTLMRLALETCATLADFEHLLDSTNVTGRYDCWNFGCLDATGVSALYECANNRYWKFDPDDPATRTPGFVARANFSLMGNHNLSGFDRFKRATDLIERHANEAPLDVKFVLGQMARDMANVFDNPYPLPYHRVQLDGPPGYIYNFGCTIANRSTTSAVVIRGVRGTENASLTTMFALLGPPVLSVAFPLWVKAGVVPIYISSPGGAPVYTYCRQRSSKLYDDMSAPFHLNSLSLVNDDRLGVYAYTLRLEAWGIEQADYLLNAWQDNPPSSSDVLWEQSRIARAIFVGFQLETAQYIDDGPGENPVTPEDLSISNYPNPFNQGTRIVYWGGSSRYPMNLQIFDIRGRLVAEISQSGSDYGEIFWSGKNMVGDNVSSGVYLYKLSNGPHEISNKMLILK
jgi:hypothetical protein